MNKKYFFIVVLVCLSCVALAQKKRVLFTIDDSPYYTDEFVRVYNKNLDLVKDEEQKDIDNYLDLYLGYKLKVKKAYSLGLDKELKYQNELSDYRKQLVKNYISDTEITYELVREAYDRSLKEIRASHILVALDPSASPEDTLQAYRRIQAIRQHVIKGESFERLAEENSDDPSAIESRGDLGYFSVFKMVYPFESAAYKTKIGEISEIVRTRFGYHIVKVNDIRDNRGQITVAHIMIGKTKDDDRSRRDALSKIGTIHRKLEQGESFEALARQFSEDKNTAEQGGNLGTITSGQLNSLIFEDAAFSIENVGEYTKPIETEFGWHIIKLIEKYPQKPFEEAEKDIRLKLQTNERAKVVDQIMVSRLKKKYKPKIDYTLLRSVVDLVVTESYYAENFTIPQNTTEFNKTSIAIGKKKIAATEFLTFIKNEQDRKQRVQPLELLKGQLVTDFVSFSLTEHHDQNLENEFPEFKYIMDEYREGLLLFDLMEKEIWEKAQNDTLALEKFYHQNPGKYYWSKRLKAVVASSVNKKFVEQTKQYFEQEKSVDFIKQELNKDAVVNIMIDEGFYEQKSNGLPKDYDLSVGVSQVYKEGDYYYVILGKEIIPPFMKTFEEAKNKVINDYQEYLESTWIDSLKEEFKCKINKKAMKKVKKQLGLWEDF